MEKEFKEKETEEINIGESLAIIKYKADFFIKESDLLLFDEHTQTDFWRRLSNLLEKFKIESYCAEYNLAKERKKLFKKYGPWINIIYTYNEPRNKSSQEVTDYKYDSIFFESKDNFVDFLARDLPPGKLDKLSRISCCVYYKKKEIKLPKWYKDCDGKFLFENGKLID